MSAAEVMRLCHEFQGVGLVAGVPSRAATNAALGFPLNAARAAEASLACAPPSCATKRVERLLSSDFPGGADGGQGQFLVGRGNGRDHGVGLRCGVAGAEPAHDVGFSRRRRATAFSSRLRRRGRRRRNRRRSRAPRSGIRGRRLSARRAVPASVFGVVPRTIPRPAARTFCGMPVLRRALAAATALLFPAAASRASRAT